MENEERRRDRLARGGGAGGGLDSKVLVEEARGVRVPAVSQHLLGRTAEHDATSTGAPYRA